MIIFSHDPGSKNYGYCILKIRGNSVKILENGLINNPISQLVVDVHTDYNKYADEIVSILNRYPVDLVCAERYVSRIRGKTIECVNMMLGGLLEITTSNSIPVKLFNSAVWKNCINKVGKVRQERLNDFYLLCKPLPDHICDSTFIGIYAASKFYNKPKLITNINPIFMKRLSNQLRKTTKWEQKKVSRVRSKKK